MLAEAEEVVPVLREKSGFGSQLSLVGQVVSKHHCCSLDGKSLSLFFPFWTQPGGEFS